MNKFKNLSNFDKDLLKVYAASFAFTLYGLVSGILDGDQGRIVTSIGVLLLITGFVLQLTAKGVK